MKTHDGYSEPKPDAARLADEDAYTLRRDALDRAIRFAATEAGSNNLRTAPLVIAAAGQFEAYLKGPATPAPPAA